MSERCPTCGQHVRWTDAEAAEKAAREWMARKAAGEPTSWPIVAEKYGVTKAAVAGAVYRIRERENLPRLDGRKQHDEKRG